MNRVLKAIAASVLFGFSLVPNTAHAGRIWFDGSRDDETGPPAALLSDNPGYWGDAVHTGVTYTYESEPDAPADTYAGKSKRKLGTTHVRLLDGITKKEAWWGGPVGIKDKPLVVVFDFKQICKFTEFDLCAADAQPMAITIETKKDEKDNWQSVYHRDREEKGESVFRRMTLPAVAQARYVRVSVKQEDVSSLSEFFAWGTADAPATVLPNSIAGEFHSIRGVEATKFFENAAHAWKDQIGQDAGSAVWSSVPTWDKISGKPILPTQSELLSQLKLVLPRNGAESIAIALTSTNIQAASRLKVQLTEVHPQGSTKPVDGIQAKAGVFGALLSRNYGAVVSPIFYADNLPGKSLLRASLLNPEAVEELPFVTLSPAGSAVLWLTVDTNGAAPGNYEATLRVDGGPDLSLAIQVLNVMLPNPFRWTQAWSDPTPMFPFQYEDRMAKEVVFMQDFGLNVWDGLPTPGSKSAFARKQSGQIFHTFILPGKYVGGGWSSTIRVEDLKDEDFQVIRQHVLAVVQQAKELGLSYNEWYGELWDEPSRRNMPLFSRLAKFVKEIDPRINLVANPPFWENGHMMRDDNAAYQALTNWYDRYVDVSCPALIAEQTLPKCAPFFNAPRWINASYQVGSQMSKNEAPEESEKYRMAAWDAFRKGWNGWGVYAYYRPTATPWNDSDGDDRGYEGEAADYQLVFPGPFGPIPTRPVFGLKAGVEDYRLLSLLKEQGQDEIVSQLLSSYTSKTATYTELRIRALQQAAKTSAH